jgi:ubiquinone/menaquinone biosynthesis C-methylase UbiE
LNRKKASFFDTQADQDWADAEYSPEETAKIQRLIQETGIKAGTHIVEPGCGTGRLTKILSDTVGLEGRVTAFDISPKMTEKCRSRLEHSRNVEIYLSSTEDFIFEKQVVDMVLCHQVFPHFDDKPLAVRLLANALKPDGKFVVFHFRNSAWINDLHRKAHPAVIADMIPSPQEMKIMFEAAGMKIDTLRDDEQGYFLSASFDLQNRRKGDIRK